MWRIKTREELNSWKLANSSKYANWATPEMDYLYGLVITDQEAQFINTSADSAFRKQWYPDKNPRKDSNWALSVFHIIEVSDVQSPKERELQVGDLVNTKEMPSAAKDKSPDDLIIAKVKGFDHYIVYSKEWESKEIGHTGDGYSKAGCWNVDKFNLTLNNKTQNELRTTDCTECHRGTESTIHSRKLQIASGSRFTGSETTDFQIGARAQSGFISHNPIQSQ